MSRRSSWKGSIQFDLVSVPVKAYSTTVAGDGEIPLHHIHLDCHSPIRHQKLCPVHGEVGSDEIVSAYEFTKGEFVVIDPNDLEKLRTENDKAIAINVFVAPEAIDPIYHSGRSYYLVPDGPVGQRPYALLFEEMKAKNRHAVAQVVLHGREQLVLLRPMGHLLVMTVLRYAQQVVKPAAFEEEVSAPEISTEEQQMVATLIDASTTPAFDIAKYKDAYNEKLAKLIEAKAAGKEIVAAPAPEEARLLNLMEALRESVDRVQEAVAAKPSMKRETLKKTS